MSAMAVVLWLHVLFAVAWMGSLLLWTLVIWPGLLRRPAPQARAALMALGPGTGLLMTVTGLGTLGFGLALGTLYGPVRSWDALLHTGYGRSYLAALLLVLGIIAFGRWARGRMGPRLFEGEGYRPGGKRFVHLVNGATLAGALLILVCMVRMRFGG